MYVKIRRHQHTRVHAHHNFGVFLSCRCVTCFSCYSKQIGARCQMVAWMVALASVVSTVVLTPWGARARLVCVSSCRAAFAFWFFSLPLRCISSALRAPRTLVVL